MATGFTTILKLALPVQGELSGTWGTVVNDNITQMVEESIAGLATINSWSTNAHTLTTANGTTSESRCAMLSLTDTGSSLSGAASVVCPAATKTYIVKNSCGQAATLKTASGTGIAVPNGKTMLLFCDGTNVVEAVDHVVTMSAGTLTITGLTTFASLKGADSTTVTGILDEDNMASNSNVKLATQQSIKAYVDSQVATSDTLPEVLANGNTTGGTDVAVSTDDKVQFRDSAIYINSSTDGQLDIVADTEIQIAATTIDINGAINASGEIIAASLDISGDIDVDGTTNLDVVDIDGAVDMASTLTLAGNADFNGDLDVDGTIEFDALSGTGSVAVTDIADEDNMSSNSATKLATQQSIKAYVDSQVGTVDTLAEVLANGNTTGSTDIEVTSAQKVQFRDSAIYINSSTDGQLDIVADTEIQIAATTIDINGAINASGEIIAASLDISGDIDVDGTTNLDVVDIDGAVDMASTLAVGGVVTANAGVVVDNITIDGQEIDVSSGDLTLDVAGDIILDADGADIKLLNGGTHWGSIYTNATPANLYIQSMISDGDIYLSGSDGGSNINALVLDMSAAGAATFNSTVTANAGVVVDNITIDGTEIDLSSGDLTLDVAGDINLDAGGGDVIFKHGGALRGHLKGGTSAEFELKSLENNADFVIKGVDNNAEITALTLDMSEAGAATFNSTVTASGTSVFASLDISGDIDVDGTTNLDVVDIDGAVDMASTLAVGGVVTANAGVVVDNITIDGTEIDLSSGDLTLDVAGDIILDADGGNILIKDGSVGTFLDIQQDANGAELVTRISDGDFKIRGNDGGSIITALTLDMSAAGFATFNSGISVGDNATFLGSQNTITADDGFLRIEETDGTDITYLGDITGAGVGGLFLYNHGGSGDTILRADAASTIAHGLSVGGAATFTTADNDPQLTLISTDADASVGPVLKLYRNSASPADNDALGRLLFTGEDDAGNEATYARIETIATDVSNGSENAKMEFYVAINDTFNPSLTLEDTGAATFAGAITANAGVVVDNITIDGTEIDLSSGDLTLDVAGVINLDADGAEVAFKDGGTHIGSIINNSSDFVFRSIVQDKDVLIRGNDGGSAITACTFDMSEAGAATFNDSVTIPTIAYVGTSIVHQGDSNTSLDFGTDTQTFFAGGTQTLDLASGSVVINEGSADVDFRVESNNNTHMLFVDGGNDRITIGGSDGTGSLHVKNKDNSGSDVHVVVQNTTNNRIAGYKVQDESGNTGINLLYDNGANTATLESPIGDLTVDGAGDIILDADGGDIQFKDGGTLVGALDLTGGFAIKSSVSDADFFIQGNDGGSAINALIFDMSAAGAATFNSTIAAGATTFTTADNSNVLTLICTDADANAGPNVKFFRNSSSPADGDNLGRISFVANNDAAEEHSFARISATITDASNATEDGTLEFATSVATTENVSRILMGATETVINEDSADLDFRVESNGNANMLFVDAGNDRVGIGTSSPGKLFTIGESADGTKLRLNRAGVSEWDFSIGNTSTLSGVGSGALEILPQNGGTAQELAIGPAGGGTAYVHVTASGVTFSGSISKGSGSFRIDHPLPAKTDTHHLVHSFVEAPQADNIYRGSVDLVDGVATVNIDTAAGMTDGTFVLLNTNVQCFTSNESGWTAIKGSVSGNTLTITAQDNSCTDTISWMVVGERHDQHMKDTDWTDSNGKVIVEPEKT
jgi:cytoskeletal protein CcmA (bactofilin family)